MLDLRPWTGGDLDALVAICRADPQISSSTSLPGADREALARWLDAQHEGWATGERLSFAVVEAAGPVGGVVLKTAGAPAAGEVGYWTAGHARGRGIASQAVERLCAWAGETRGLRRLDLLHQVDNRASCRVAEKTGFTLRRVLPAEPPFPRDGHLHSRDLPLHPMEAGG